MHFLLQKLHWRISNFFSKNRGRLKNIRELEYDIRMNRTFWIKKYICSPQTECNSCTQLSYLLQMHSQWCWSIHGACCTLACVQGFLAVVLAGETTSTTTTSSSSTLRGEESVVGDWMGSKEGWMLSALVVKVGIAGKYAWRLTKGCLPDRKEWGRAWKNSHRQWDGVANNWCRVSTSLRSQAQQGCHWRWEPRWSLWTTSQPVTRSTPDPHQSNDRSCHKNHGDLTQRASRAQMHGFDSLSLTHPLGLTFPFISSMLDDWQRGACREEWNGDNGRRSSRWQLEWVAALPSCNYEHGKDSSKQQPELPAPAEYQLRTMGASAREKKNKKRKHSNRLATVMSCLFIQCGWSDMDCPPFLNIEQSSETQQWMGLNWKVQTSSFERKCTPRNLDFCK